MTLSKLTDVASALSQRYMGRLARQDNRMAVLAAALPSVPGFGKNVAWDVAMDGAVADSYAEGDDMTSGELAVDTLVPATLSWGHYRGGFHVSETELDAAATSAGSAEALLNLLEERLHSTVTKLASKLNSDLWVGDGTDGSSNPTIVGLHGGALDESGTYAGLSRASYSLWAGNVLANGGSDRALSMDLMEQADENIFTASGEKCNVIVCDEGVYRKYKGLFESIRRVQGSGPIDRYDTSTSNVFWQGIPVLRDKDAPAGTMTFVNTDHAVKVFLPPSNQASADVWKRMMRPGLGDNGAQESNSLSMPFSITPLAKNGDSVKFMVKSVCALKVTRPGSMAIIKDIQV